MHALKLAFRNTLRNKRRTVATISAVMISCAGLLLFAGYTTWAHWAAELHAITQVGHIQVFRKGFNLRGSGNPSAFAIGGYDRIKKMLLEDPALEGRLQLVTGQLLVSGLASSAANQTSTPFMGLGVFADEHREVIDWNPHHLHHPSQLKINRHIFEQGAELDAADPNGASLGAGLAAILQVGTEPAAPDAHQDDKNPGGPEQVTGVPDLILGPPSAPTPPTDPRQVVELLSIPAAGGTPNMASLSVRSIVARATKDIDDRLLKMPIAIASGLVFPGEEIKVTSMVILLRNTEDVPWVSARLNRLIEEQGLDLETRTWLELAPDYERSMQMFDMFFSFTLCVVSVVLIFTIFNTIYMGVMERVGEIGTIRAMGMTRAGVMLDFLLEGLLLGSFGAGLGVLLGMLAAELINKAEIVYHPPFVPFYAKLEVLVLQNPASIVASFSGCLLVAVAASLPAARRAARMNIADALRS